MPVFSTPAIILRKVEYGDFDLIITFFSLTRGKVSLIAKSAKKSTKRFAGILELFCELQITGSARRGRGLPVLQEAALKQPFSSIRADITKTAYASYWAELVCRWMEEKVKHAQLYHLLAYVLGELNASTSTPAALSVLFQMRLLTISGHRPNLAHCGGCRRAMETVAGDTFVVDVAKGGILCGQCAPRPSGRPRISRGTLKELLWAASGDFARARRIRFPEWAIAEGLQFLELFVPYHLEKQPRSLKFLRQIRKEKGKRSKVKG